MMIRNNVSTDPLPTKGLSLSSDFRKKVNTLSIKPAETPPSTQASQEETIKLSQWYVSVENFDAQVHGLNNATPHSTGAIIDRTDDSIF